MLQLNLSTPTNIIAYRYLLRFCNVLSILSFASLSPKKYRSNCQPTSSTTRWLNHRNRIPVTKSFNPFFVRKSIDANLRIHDFFLYSTKAFDPSTEYTSPPLTLRIKFVPTTAKLSRYIVRNANTPAIIGSLSL